MQGNEIKKLCEHLAKVPWVREVVFVEKREYGPNDLDNSGYIRLDTDREAKNFILVGDFWVGRYFLVLDITGQDETTTVNQIASAFDSFRSGMVHLSSVGTNSDVIYKIETSEELTVQCEYVRFEFDLSTSKDCVLC